MNSSNVTLDFASALVLWNADEPEVIGRSLDLLIDGLAVASAGADQSAPQMLGAAALEEGSRPVSTVIGQGFAAAPAAAARVNGAAMHVLDFEPMWDPPNHAVSTILPALLALSEKLEAEDGLPRGAAVLSALAKGVEAQGRLRLASRQFDPGKLLFHPPGVVGPLASAVACGALLGFGPERLAAALGIAASRAGGIIANVGSMTKSLHCGDAAAHGLESALWARRGFGSNADALAAAHGYGRAYFGSDFDPAPLIAPIVTPRIMDPGMAWKLYPSQYATHFAITAALECRRQIADSSAIRAVSIRMPLMGYIDRPSPATGLEGKFSIQYCAAAALLDGQVQIESFSDGRLFSADIQAMLRAIVLHQDSSLPGAFDQMHLDLELELLDGSRVRWRCTAPDGAWSRPISGVRVREKAQGLFQASLGQARSAEFWKCIDVGRAGLRIADLMSPLRGLPPADAGAANQ